MPKRPLSWYVNKYGEIPKGKVFLQYEGEGSDVSVLDDAPVWRVPPKVAIVAAPTGAFFDRGQNENQLYSTAEILEDIQSSALTPGHARSTSKCGTSRPERPRATSSSIARSFFPCASGSATAL